MTFSLEIRFKKSTSQSYPDALKLLKTFSNVVLAESGDAENIVTISEVEFIEKFIAVTDLWWKVTNWKNSRVLINGQPADISDLNTYVKVMDCHKEYKRAIVQDEHCNLHASKEGWKCKFLVGVNRYLPDMFWSRSKHWYDFGYFESENIWRIKKEKIAKILQREAEFKKVFICPVFSFERVDAIISNLPDFVDLSADDKWEIVYEDLVEDSVNGALLQRKPVKIKPKNVQIKDGQSIYLSDREKADDKKEVETREQRSIPDVTFSDIGGIDDIVQTIREIIELPIKRPEMFKYLGIKPHKGILLYGLPGTGKTLIAKAIANEVKAHFIAVKGPELLSKFHGESEENIRAVFEEANKLQPSIIYFDEIDSIAQSRSGDETLRFEAKIVNQLLTLMDGIEDYGNVRVIASTNRAELIDEALLRPGRFDYSIEVKKPTLEGCYEIFSIHTKDMPVEAEFNKQIFCKELLGLSGAEIAFVAREGAYNCLRRNVDLRQVIKDDEIDKIDYTSFVVIEKDFILALSSVRR